jgi:hypothetical protein
VVRVLLLARTRHDDDGLARGEQAIDSGRSSSLAPWISPPSECCR